MRLVVFIISLFLYAQAVACTYTSPGSCVPTDAGVDTEQPVLGENGGTPGAVILKGATSGSAEIIPQAVAGNVVINPPTISGTIAANASSPLVLNTTTGFLTCPTCMVNTTTSGPNTVWGNFTGSSAVSIANSVASCSSSNSALQYIPNSGISCATNFITTSNLNSALPSISTSQFYIGTGAAGSAQGATGATAESLLPITQSGTGAVQRTLDSKVKDIVNAYDFGASGSIQSTTCSISSSSTSMSLGSAIDFANGQGIRCNGAGASYSLGNPSGLSVTATGTTGSTHYQYQVACLDAAGGMSAAPTATTITNGNATLSTTNYNALSWTAPASNAACVVYGKTSGSMTPLIIFRNGGTSQSWNDVGTTTVTVPDWIPSSPPGAALNDYLLTSIVSGGGTTTVTVANAATNSVSGAISDHDDTVALQHCIGSLPSTGGKCYLNVGTYQFTSTTNIGNGNGTTASTTSGIILEGNASRGGINGITGTPSVLPVNLRCLWYGICIKVNGPINDWGLENLSIDLSQVASTNSFGLVTTSASFGSIRGLLVSGSYNIGILETVGTKSSNNNVWDSIQVWIPPNASFGTGSDPQGIHISGINTADVFYDQWRNVQVIPNNINHTCYYFGAVDSFHFYNIQCNPTGVGAAVAALFDYTINNTWPSDITFYSFDSYTNIFQNNGTPLSTGLNQNRIFDFSRVNGATVPSLANLALMDYSSTGTNAPTLTAGCNGSGSSITGTNGLFTVVGQTSAATTCTVTFATPVSWSNAPLCNFQGYQSAITSVNAISTSSVQVTFASTANYKFTGQCNGF